MRRITGDIAERPDRLLAHLLSQKNAKCKKKKSFKAQHQTTTKQYHNQHKTKQTQTQTQQ
jgi:hypothetical protein